MQPSRILFPAAAVLLAVGLAPCKGPQPPADDQPPEPQAQRTQLRDAMRQQIQQTQQMQEQARKAQAERERMLEENRG